MWGHATVFHVDQGGVVHSLREEYGKSLFLMQDSVPHR